MAQPTTRDASRAGHTADPAQTRAELSRLRPDLIPGYDEALPGARAAIMARLRLALAREPLGVQQFASTEARHQDGKSGALENPWLTTSTDPGARSSGPIVLWFAADEQGGRQTPDQERGWRTPGQQHGLRTLGEESGLRTPGEGSGRPIAVTDDPGTLVRALWPESGLAAEIDNSVANLALARAATHPAYTLRDATGDPDGPARLEQLVIDGHPLHPCCRTRGGFTVADVLAYAPEHRPVFRLRRLTVPPERWHGDAPPLLYAHPWQAARLLDEYPWLTDDGETGPVRPLMSLRTVAPVGGGDHIKTAVDVQMTSAVRTVSPAAVHNGPRLSALLRTLTRDLPLSVLAETAAGAVIVDGQPQRRLAYLRRQAPAVRADETVAPLGAGALIAAATKQSGGDPYRWFEDLSLILWPSLLAVLDRGVALEAHGQNTLVVLRGGRPVRILYRDLGGVRVSPRRLRAAGVEDPGLLGDLPSDDPDVLRTKLTAAAVTVVAADLVGLLEHHFGADPRRLWGIVAAAIRGTGTADAAAILTGPLPIKATTAMRLAADPLEDIWAPVDNPLAGAS